MNRQVKKIVFGDELEGPQGWPEASHDGSARAQMWRLRLRAC